jgi:hypothetical protein
VESNRSSSQEIIYGAVSPEPALRPGLRDEIPGRSVKLTISFGGFFNARR